MGDSNVHTELVDQLLQILFEDVSPAAITPAAIADQQHLADSGVQTPRVVFQPQPQAVAGELARVATQAKVQPAFVLTHVV